MSMLKTTFLILAVFHGIAFASADKDFKASVIGVINGHTLIVQTDSAQLKVRLYGIACPDLRQPYGLMACKYSARAVNGKQIQVVVKSRDDNGVIAGRVYLEKNNDGDCLNRELVKQGLAWWNQVESPTELTLNKLEKLARAKKIGLWQDDDPLPPHAFKEIKKQQKMASRKSRLRSGT
ncbi:MAG: thermonuclease family protein [Candidatus Wallbacteria bacterium]|nr:thermonuclease family protein [Candidatus Wallbacteria bacterium]